MQKYSARLTDNPMTFEEVGDPRKDDNGQFYKVEDVEQLKAEIAAIAHDMLSRCTDGADTGAIRYYTNKLRKLSGENI
jgi:hypothetical protein